MKGLVVVIIVCLLSGAISGYGAGYLVYQPKISSYQAQISTLLSEVSKLNSTVSSQGAQISRLIIDLNNAKTEALILQTKLSEGQAKVSNLTAKISTLQAEVSKAQSRINEYESQILSLKSDLAKAQKTIGNYEAEINSLRKQTSDLQSQTDSYKIQVSALQSRLDKILLGITVTQHYEWSYKTGRFWLDLPSIPLSLYVEYWERQRPNSWQDYVDMAKDPEDDWYIDKLISLINRVAAERRYDGVEKVNFVAAFVQSLPYTVDEVTTPWNEYPRYPIETLFDRGGDCEDTSILAAALLDRMGYDVALLILKYAKHVAVGVSIPDAQGSYYEYQGKKFYYLETTGEGWKLGQIPSSLKDTRAYISPLRQ